MLKRCMGLVRGMSAKVNMIEALESFAKIAALTNEPERAARLYGAASAARVAAEMPCAPARQSNNERHQAVSRQQIGDNAFCAAWSAGEAMSLDAAVEEALSPASYV